MRDIILTLSAMAQAVKQVESIAWKNQWSEADAAPLLESVFDLNPNSVVELYQGSANLTTGLRAIRSQLDNSTGEKNAEFGRYLANLFSIQKQFMNTPSVQETLMSRLEHTKKLLEFDSITSDSVITSLADCYSQSISTLALRIQVHGEPGNLQQANNQQRIRALLLAAVRAAVLWRQVGGRKRQFLFNRKAMLETVQSLLTQPIFPENTNENA